MKPLARIVEDDPEIREALADRLDSLGHDHHTVGSQTEARERLSRCTYSYVLLDLELPVRFGRPPSIQVGKNVLAEIRPDPRHAQTPVLVVTAHGHDRPDLAVEVMKAGAVDFVKKPFENLEQAIRDALHRNGNGGSHAVGVAPSAPSERRQLDGGHLSFHCDRIDLEGITLCAPENGVIWRILMLLRERKPDGKPRPFPGKTIADRLGLDRGQNAVCDAISAFRRKVVQTLEAEGIDANEDAIIITGRAGYQINAALEAVDHSDQRADAQTGGDLPIGTEERQAWFIDQVQKGRKPRRNDLEKHFGISTATAKRDLGGLSEQIEFVGTGAAGCYALKK